MPTKYEGCTGNPKCSTRAARFRCDNCKRKHADYMNAYWAIHKDRLNAMRKQRGDWIKGKYGITHAERRALFESSDGLCALCLEEPATTIDHNHETGEVRGALCHFCNKGLGYVEKMGATSPVIEEYFATAWTWRVEQSVA